MTALLQTLTPPQNEITEIEGMENETPGGEIEGVESENEGVENGFLTPERK